MNTSRTFYDKWTSAKKYIFKIIVHTRRMPNQTLYYVKKKKKKKKKKTTAQCNAQHVPLLELFWSCRTCILSKSSNWPISFYRFSSNPQTILQFYLHPQIGRVSVNIDIVRFDKILNITSKMRRWTQVPPFLKFTIFSSSSQFVKNHFLKYPIFISKTSSLLKQLTEETDLCRNEHSSCMTMVAMGQNVQTYLTTQCKFLLVLKMGVPVFICASWMQCTE